MAENPIYHSKTLTYGSYLMVPELLTLQRPKTSHPDELLFIQAHQVYELWFKQILHELDSLLALFRAARPFELLPVGGATHMVPDPVASRRVKEAELEFFTRHLQPAPAPAAALGKRFRARVATYAST